MNWIQRFLTAIAIHKGDASAHHNKIHGANEHTDVTRELWIPVTEGHISDGTAAMQGFYPTVRGDANLREPRVYFLTKVPDDFVSFISVKAVWFCSAASGNAYWKWGATYAASGEARTTHTDYPEWGVTATGGGWIMNVQEPADPLTLPNLAKGDYIGLGFDRDGTHANDTLENSFYLLGLLFTYVAEQ